MRIGQRTEVSGKVDARGTIGAERERVSTTVTTMMGFPRNIDEPVTDDESRSAVPSPLVSVFQVRKHSNSDGARIDRSEVDFERLHVPSFRTRHGVARPPPRRLCIETLGQPKEIVPEKHATAMKRVRKDRVSPAHANEKMPRKPNAFQNQPGATAHRYHHDRERNRDPDSPLDDVIQVTISRVVVTIFVAVKTEFIE